MSIAIAQGRRKMRYGAADFSVRIDAEMAAEIRAFAAWRNCSFGEAVRTLVEWGLEAERAAS